jgi:CheY-like chemotaxis protein
VLDIMVTLNSVPGRGTRVALLVPIATVAPALVPEVAAPSPLPAAAGMSVLCIDNDEKILAGMDALLSGWGCMPILAKTAREAIKLARDAARLPDLMLVDYHLDEGDGLAAVAAVRKKLGEDIPAIMITADRSPDLRERALKAGMQVLNKPVKPAALRALMTQWRVSRPAAE